MAKHCFIDESGTMPDQEIMTVALVVLDGARTAEKLHPRLGKALLIPPKVRGLKELERWYDSQKLHFAEMNDSQKTAMGVELSKANIKVFIGFCRHSAQSKNHEHRFDMYRQLLKTTISRAFETTEELVVSVAKQGGWESYGPDLLQELRCLPQACAANTGEFRKGTFFLDSPSKKGQQIADFYASASWNFLVAEDDADDRGAPYRQIQNQVLYIEEIRLIKELVKEK